MEEFRDVAGYEGSYQISNYGRVKALSREGYEKGRWGMAFVKFPEKILSICRTPTGYNYVCLCKAGVKKKLQIHRMVLRAFVGPSELQCNHLDGDKDNNNLSNLQYCTSSENLRHCIDVLGKKRGEGAGNAKLTENAVRLIRADSRTLKEIAHDYGVTLQAISHVKSRKNWSHVA